MKRDDFLVWEAARIGRWECVAGAVHERRGGTVAANVIIGSVFIALRRQLRAPCRMFQAGMMLTPAGTDDATYPDLLVTCRPAAAAQKAIKSATVIIEASHIDEPESGLRWESFRKITDLRHLVLIYPSRVTIEISSRMGPADSWQHHIIDDLGADLAMPAIGAAIPVRDIYDGTEVAGC
jgi:hypothetical protein